MAGRYPKPDAERRNPNPPAFGWTFLSPKVRVRVPELPAGSWSATTRAWWADLWSSPQAVMWDASGRTLHGAAFLVEVRAATGTTPSLESELRQHYDRHGLNPKAMLQLRWRIGNPGDLDNVAPEANPTAPTRSARPGDARRRRLARQLGEAS